MTKPVLQTLKALAENLHDPNPDPNSIFGVLVEAERRKNR